MCAQHDPQLRHNLQVVPLPDNSNLQVTGCDVNLGASEGLREPLMSHFSPPISAQTEPAEPLRCAQVRDDVSGGRQPL